MYKLEVKTVCFECHGTVNFLLYEDSESTYTDYICGDCICEDSMLIDLGFMESKLLEYRAIERSISSAN